MRKLLDLSDECVTTLSKRAIDEHTDFKNLAQDILERSAVKKKKLIKLKRNNDK